MRAMRAKLRGLAATGFAALAGVLPAAPGRASQGAAPESGGVLSLSQAIDLALAANRSLAAARLGLPIARANVDVAGERPNPDLTVEKLRETPHESITLAQPVETAGKRRRRIDLAQAETASTEAEIARATIDIRNRVRRAYYALAAAQDRASETGEILRLTARARDAARERFDAGAVPRLEVLQTELTAAQADNEAEAARGLLAGASADLNTLIDRPPQSPLAVAGGLAIGSVPDAAAAARLAAAASTELALQDRRIAAQAARVELARAEQFPNLTVQGAVTFHAPPDFQVGYRAALSVSLPIFTHHEAGVRAAEATLAQLRAERDAAAAQIAGSVSAAAAQAAAQRRQLLRFRDEILPQAAAVQQMAEDSYRSGQSNLVALLQVLQSTRELRLRAIQAGLDFQVALAELERAMGAPLP